MGWNAHQFNSRAFNTGPGPSRELLLLADVPENGWAAWTYSKTAKLNAWSWHGLGVNSNSRVNAWATIGNQIYLRRDSDTSLYAMTPDVFLAASEENQESQKVYAETQWLDFGKPGLLKGIEGMDFDGKNIDRIEFYMSVDGNRSGELAVSVPLSQDGWTYSGGIIPVELASTEFKLRFVGSANLEVQVNKLTLYWEELGDM